MSREINLLLVGLTGNGKSSTGNSILQKKEFYSKSSATSVSRDIVVGIGNYENYELKVVDTLGLQGKTKPDKKPESDLRLRAVNETEYIKQVEDAYKEAMLHCSSGYDAIILVLNFSTRYTAEDENAVIFLKGMFGDFLKNHCILVMTHGDQFATSPEGESVNFSFEKYCKSQSGEFQRLVEECDNRIILFDNKGGNPDVSKLLSHATSLSNNKGRYGRSEFDCAASSRKKMMVKSKKPKISEKAFEKKNDFEKLLDKAKKEANIDEQIKALRSVRDKVEEFLKDLQEKDCGTNVLISEITMLNDIINQVKTNEELAKQRKDAEGTCALQ